MRDRHALQICVIPDSLKVTADKQEVNFVVVSGLQILDVSVDFVKMAVTTAFDRDFHRDLENTLDFFVQEWPVSQWPEVINVVSKVESFEQRCLLYRSQSEMLTETTPAYIRAPWTH